MKQKRSSEEQITEVLRLHQAEAKPADPCRRHVISEAMLYDWRSRYGGMQVSEAKRLRLRDGRGQLSISIAAA